MEIEKKTRNQKVIFYRFFYNQYLIDSVVIEDVLGSEDGEESTIDDEEEINDGNDDVRLFSNL